ncbi:hypothetical protein Tsp_11332 [Trichinella spiralis]|uniref:hypothetical protein n=1 Tax=Trichinella spiralis TaxID=6334 RepID=UPI0001EFEF31|nr:hypothetical protein Tsp_11332 [Trichinella spiralis]
MRICLNVMNNFCERDVASLTKIFATHHSESFAADRTSTVKECSGPSHRLRDKFAAKLDVTKKTQICVYVENLCNVNFLVALKLQAQAMGKKSFSICVKG